MDAVCYLDECKAKLGVGTNYALAKALNINQSRIGEYYKGKTIPDDYACFKFAECLEIDPAIVIAEIRASSEKNPEKREYFRAFRGACGKAAAGIMLALALSVFFASAPPDGAMSKLAAGAAAVAASAAFLRRSHFA